MVNEKNYNSFLKAKAKLGGNAPLCKCPRARATAHWPLLWTRGPERATTMRGTEMLLGPSSGVERQQALLSE